MKKSFSLLSIFLYLFLIAPHAHAAGITRVQFVHDYIATSGVAASFASNVTAGDLVVVLYSANVAANPTVTDGLGSTWHCFGQKVVSGSGDTFQNLCYTLSSNGGGKNITLTDASASDMGFTAIDYNGIGTWTVDSSLPSGIYTDGSTLSLSTFTPTTSTWSTGGANDVIVNGYGNEDEAFGTITATSPFSLVQSDPVHTDAQSDRINVGAQTNQTASFSVTSSVTFWGIYTAAFTLSSSGTTPVFNFWQFFGF